MRSIEKLNPTPSTAGHRSRSLAASVCVSTLMLGATGLGIAAIAGAADGDPSPAPITEPASTWQAIYAGCMHGSASTPDSLEHYVDLCTARATAFFESTAYVRCVRGMSADAAERWAGTCADQALGDGE